MKKDVRMIVVKINADVHKKIKILAAQKGTTMNNFVNDLLSENLKSYEGK
jgi:predicted HicB family RNase H-like nuclease